MLYVSHRKAVCMRMLHLITHFFRALRPGLGKNRAARLQTARPLTMAEWHRRASRWYDSLIYAISPVWLMFVKRDREDKARKAGLLVEYEYQPSGVDWNDTSPPSIVQTETPKVEFPVDATISAKAGKNKELHRRVQPFLFRLS